MAVEIVARRPEQFVVEDPEILNSGSCNSVVEYFRYLQELLPPYIAFEISAEKDARLKKLDPKRTTFFADGVVTTTRIAAHTYRDFINDEEGSYTAYLDILTSFGHIFLPFQSTEERTLENVNIFNDQP